jgi:ribonuclease P protein component
MLSSKNRLKKKINFARVEIDGKLIQSKSFGMGVYDRSKDFDGDSNNTDSRFGFIVSTKISKKAVVRNKIKRIIAESIRKRLPNIKKGQDIVFLIKPNVIKITKKELENEVHEIITKNIQVHNLPHP